MKKVIMLKTMASPKMSAVKGQVLNLEDEFATALIGAKACTLVEEIHDVEFTAVEEIQEAVEKKEEVEKAVKKSSKKRK